jgi:hypothetical protein
MFPKTMNFRPLYAVLSMGLAQSAAGVPTVTLRSCRAISETP